MRKLSPWCSYKIVLLKKDYFFKKIFAKLRRFYFLSDISLLRLNLNLNPRFNENTEPKPKVLSGKNYEVKLRNVLVLTLPKSYKIWPKIVMSKFDIK